jgi:succinate dehydrogenase/fumarate reductase flavoprotein subunit
MRKTLIVGGGAAGMAAAIAAAECGDPGNLVLGANIAGFKKVATVMLAQGLI